MNDQLLIRTVLISTILHLFFLSVFSFPWSKVKINIPLEVDLKFIPSISKVAILTLPVFMEKIAKK